jgi:asparagine synthetase B (glutamine-hydrolysing)
MPFEDENFVISYNGEIYNFETLKKDLIDQGEYFLTNSDTEVIIKLFKKYGILTFDKLEGMFAVAIYDKKKSKLYLTRDVFGIKPLYYYLDSEKIIFSSEFETILNNFELEFVDLIQINIEGDEYDLLEHMIKTGSINKFKNIQIQFHLGIKNDFERRNKIKEGLQINGFINKFDYQFVWESWAK